MDPQEDTEQTVRPTQQPQTQKRQGRKQPQQTSGKTTQGPKKIGKKRGPPRPHKKLEQVVLETRVAKLQRRIDRAGGQLQDAQRHIDGYHREISFRRADALSEVPVAA